MQELRHRTIVVADVADFTDPDRTLIHQFEVHEALYELFGRAFRESGLDLNKCEVEDRGDGMLILLPADMPKDQLADRLPGRLLAGLRRHNAKSSRNAGFKLRIGFHAGEVRMNAHGVVSQEINLAFRILNAKAAKEALRQSDEVLAVIASDWFYHAIIEQDPATNPKRFTEIPVERTSSMAWLSLPDGGQSVPEVLQRNDVDQLQRLLKQVTKVDVPQLLTLIRRAGGPSTPPPTDPCPDAWEALEHLADFNADGDGFPPQLEFLQLLARYVDNPLRDYLTEWVDSQARRLRLGSVLQTRQTRDSPVPAESRLHLLIMVQPDRIDPGRLLLSYWRQDDPDEWPPAQGDTYQVTLDELELQVDELIVAAERAWSSHGGTAALEFLLPRTLFGLPLHRWRKEHSSGLPRLLCMNYPLVVRSLERMMTTEWHRVWRERWGTMTADPSQGRVHFCQPADREKPDRLDAILGSPQWTLMVLSGPPPMEPLATAGEDELNAALRAGIPAMIWHPEVSSEGLREIVEWLVSEDGMVDLPARTKASRLTAFQDAPPFDADLVSDLVLLWDDPGRMVVLDPAVGPAAAVRNGG